MKREYFVVQEHTHDDRKCLWSVLTRPLKSILSAQDWRDSAAEKAAKTGRKTFVVEKISDEEIQRRLDAGEQFQISE